jgi:hypothetical protein
MPGTHTRAEKVTKASAVVSRIAAEMRPESASQRCAKMNTQPAVGGDATEEYQRKKRQGDGRHRAHGWRYSTWCRGVAVNMIEPFALSLSKGLS